MMGDGLTIEADMTAEVEDNPNLWMGDGLPTERAGTTGATGSVPVPHQPSGCCTGHRQRAMDMI